MIINGAVSAASEVSGKGSASCVIGHAGCGHTLAEVDYLCTGMDDQVVINEAIQAVAEGGGKIILRAGTYVITEEIEMKKEHITLEGEGTSTLIQLQTGPDYPKTPAGVVRISANNCAVKNLRIDGQATAYLNDNKYGIYMEGCNHIVIEGTTSNNSGGGGLYAQGGSNISVWNSTFCYNTLAGIHAEETSNIKISGNTCSDNMKGIYINK